MRAKLFILILLSATLAVTGVAQAGDHRERRHHSPSSQPAPKPKPEVVPHPQPEPAPVTKQESAPTEQHVVVPAVAVEQAPVFVGK